MRVLLSDGSGLTSRQCATQLAAAGHEVEVLSTDRFALTSFTRHVSRIHRTPPFGDEPLAWMDQALAVLDRERAAGRPVDVVLPTQEQVTVLACRAEEVRSRGTGLAVPTPEALARIFDKVNATGTLKALGIPVPATTIAGSREQLAAHDTFPVYAKSPIGTASTGVRLVRTAADLSAFAQRCDPGVFEDGGVVLQGPIAGDLAMVQGVFDSGRLVAWHANVRSRVGVNGGASGKRGVDLAAAGDYLAALASRLRWTGGLSFDCIVPADGGVPVVIDVNPRLVEPANAWHSGVDLVEAMLAVSCGKPYRGVKHGCPGTATHQLVLALLAAANRGRLTVLQEVAAALRRRGSYAASIEELTPLSGDLPTVVPLLLVTAAALAGPWAAGKLATGTVTNYSLSSEGWRQLRQNYG